MDGKGILVFVASFWSIILGLAIVAYEKPILLAWIAGTIAAWLGFCVLVTRGR